MRTPSDRLIESLPTNLHLGMVSEYDQAMVVTKPCYHAML